MSGGERGCRVFYYAIAKYGYDSFKFEILHSGILLQEELDALEQDEILKNNSVVPNGYNLKAGGSHGKHSEETKKKMRESIIKARLDGKMQSQERKDKLSEKSKKNWANPEYRFRMKKTLCIMNEKRRESASAKRLEREIKINEYKKTDEYKKEIEEKEKRERHNRHEGAKKAQLHPNAIAAKIRRIKETSIPCFCETNNKLYASAGDASRDLNLDQGSISKIIRGDGLSTGGYYFRPLNKKELQQYKKSIA